MGLFNDIGEIRNERPQLQLQLQQQQIHRRLQRQLQQEIQRQIQLQLEKKQPQTYLKPIFLSSQTINSDSGLYIWSISGSSPDLEQNGNKITIKRDCTLIVLLDGIKSRKGECELIIKDKDSRLLNSYKASNNRKNESISVNCVDQFKAGDELYIESSGISGIQLTIYGNN